MKKMKRAFTLIELLVVTAISVIILTIIAVPMIQGFSITRAAAANTEVQRIAGEVVGKMQKDIGEAAYVRSNAGAAGSLGIVLPDDTNTSSVFFVPRSKIDLFPPAKGDLTINSQPGEFVNPDTGRVDPTASGPMGDPNFPAAPGMVMVRWFIGLQDPELAYSNPYSTVETSTGQPWLVDVLNKDNLYVLYRAEVSPWRFVDADSNPATPLVKQANSDFFAVDGDGNPILDDPYFFTRLSSETPAQTARRAKWKSKATIETSFTRHDMIGIETNPQNNRMILFNGRPRISSLVRFQPERVNSEAAAGQTSLIAGSESSNSEKVGPSQLMTEHGAWDARSLRIAPSQYQAGGGWGAGSAGAVQPPYNGGLYLQTVQDPTFNMLLLGSDGTTLFAVDEYQRLKTNGSAFPFTLSTAPSALIGPWDVNFVPFQVNRKSGRVQTYFDIRDVGSASGSTPGFNHRVPTSPAMLAANTPGIHVGPAIPFNADTSSGDWASFDWDDGDNLLNVGINRRYNKLWHNFASLAPGLDRSQYVKRYVDLRLMRQWGDIPSPLDKRPTSGGGFGATRGSIRPGSERVFGPDQRPGPNYGRNVMYQRTTQRPVGPNQYLINYVDQPEPDWAGLGFAGVNYDKADHDPQDFVSAVLQARYRAGYVEFNSSPGEPIPHQYDPTPASPNSGDEVATGNIYVTYDFQFTEPNDTFFVDYDSADSIEVVLTVLTYPQSTNVTTPQSVTVRGSATVKNNLR
jgi:prepilin-type N-terminal cleavage/methylation domain-containing protein